MSPDPKTSPPRIEANPRDVDFLWNYYTLAPSDPNVIPSGHPWSEEIGRLMSLSNPLGYIRALNEIGMSPDELLRRQIAVERELFDRGPRLLEGYGDKGLRRRAEMLAAHRAVALEAIQGVEASGLRCTWDEERNEARIALPAGEKGGRARGVFRDLVSELYRSMRPTNGPEDLATIREWIGGVLSWYFPPEYTDPAPRGKLDRTLSNVAQQDT